MSRRWDILLQHSLSNACISFNEVRFFWTSLILCSILDAIEDYARLIFFLMSLKFSYISHKVKTDPIMNNTPSGNFWQPLTFVISVWYSLVNFIIKIINRRWIEWNIFCVGGNGVNYIPFRFSLSSTLGILCNNFGRIEKCGMRITQKSKFFIWSDSVW